MADMNRSSSFRNLPGAGKQPFLPPKSPFPSAPQPASDYISNHVIGPKGAPHLGLDYISNHVIGPKGAPQPASDYLSTHVIGPKGVLGDRHEHHQRASSTSFFTEEQPSWLDDLLNEPEMPVKRGAHRRSSSDSFAYMGAANLSFDSLAQDGSKHPSAAHLPSWGDGEFDYFNDAQYPSYYKDLNLFRKSHTREWELTLNVAAYPNITHPTVKEKNVHPGAGTKEPNAATPVVADKQGNEESTPDTKGSSERKDGSYGKQTPCDMDTKRVKQQYAQRSRIRKLQYIAELERNVQALQADGLEVSAELEFLNQQNLMLDLENKALKQRLDSIAQEHLIKCLQHEMLEREITRLQALLFHQQHQQQQQPQQQPTPNLSRRNSRDLDSQFANLSLKQKEASSGQDPVNGQLRP